eukprot:COSAG01_NODE_1305_length_10807_cov_3.074897_1_plen_234_part_10
MSLSELESVHARLASMADEKLDPVLAKLLPKLLTPQMVAAPNAALRGKVVAILTHVNKRVKSAPGVQLPVAELLRTYSPHPNPKAVETNFIIMYLQFGVPRLPPAAKSAHLPALLRQIAARPPGQQATLCRLLLDVAASYELPAEGSARESLVAELAALPRGDLGFAQEFLLDVLLFFPPPARPDPASPRGVGAAAAVRPGSEAGRLQAAGAQLAALQRMRSGGGASSPPPPQA